MRRIDRSMLDEPPVPPALYQEIESISSPLAGADDLDRLLERIGDARFVLLGEASHGTSEYYDWRAALSRRLICEKGFSFLAVEGDWPDCYRLNRYVKRLPDSGRSARAVLRTFERWPTWMWANREVETLVEWLHDWNQRRPPDRRIGFYVLDVYSLWDSMHAVLDYLDRVDPDAAQRARHAYGCFDPYEQDVQEYALATKIVPTSCEDEAVRTLHALRRNAPQYREDGREDDVFSLIGPKRYDAPWKDLERQAWIATATCVEERIPMSTGVRMEYALADRRSQFRIAAENPAKMDRLRELLAARDVLGRLDDVGAPRLHRARGRRALGGADELW